MKHINCRIVMSTALVSVLLGGIGSAWGEENAEQPAAAETPAAPAAPTALTTPPLTGPLAGNPNPINFRSEEHTSELQSRP